MLYSLNNSILILMIPPIAQFLTAINNVLEKEKRAQAEKQKLTKKAGNMNKV